MLSSLYTAIVNWNLKEDTTACLRSLLAAGVPLNRVIVLDNGSTDGSPEALSGRFGEDLHLIRSERNMGFAQGSNLAIQHALAQGAEWVFILNNDTIVSPTLMHELANAYQATEEYAILSPLIYYHEEPDRIWHMGHRIIPGSLMTYRPCRRLGRNRDLPELIPVDFVSGCGMLVKREVFERIGLFDPDFFMYGEEVDFCWRARAAGFRTACACRAKMWHKVATSARRDKVAARYLRIRNQIRIYRRYSNWSQLPIMLALTSARILFLALGDLVKGQPELLRPSVHGWAHGWLRPDSDVTKGLFNGNDIL